MKRKKIFTFLLIMVFIFVGCVPNGYEKVELSGRVQNIDELLCTCFELITEDGKMYSIRYDEFEDATRDSVNVNHLKNGDVVIIKGERKQNTNDNSEILLKKVKVIK
ncbi:MAG: hypothetical protein HYV32_00645 [Candidatus Kerfeldbacteria bacterium]|nr:hypothetical protein [Candidatus Kerfeldbacteria bacterium]